MQKQKLYGRYNKLSKQIEFIFLTQNDEIAEYQYALSHIAAIEKNPYHNEDDYVLICLGVVRTEGEIKEVGIEYEYKKDFPFIFDYVEPGQKPKYNIDYFKDITIKNQAKKEALIQKAGV